MGGQRATNAMGTCPLIVGDAPPTKMTLETLKVSANLRHHLNKLYRVPMNRLDCSFGVVTTKGKVPLQQAIEHEAKAQKANVMILLATRRSG